MGKRYSVLGVTTTILLPIVIAVSILTSWLGFLLLPITGLVAYPICGVMLALGTFVFALSKKEMPWRIMTGHDKSTLITSGIYSRIRHPHYLAHLLWCFGIALGSRSLIGLLIASINAIVTYEFALEEEKELEQRFGDRHREYKSRVPMFIPKLRRKD